MSETRICPVCMKQIPRKDWECCFYCGFNLSKLDDEKNVEKAKQWFTCGKFKSKKFFDTILKKLFSAK